MAPEQIRHQRHGGGDDGLPEESGESGGQVQRQEFDIDSVLDEIDGVLETNAEEFVRGFVQKGGE
ncbi:MAG: ubiquitin-like protein Pup [Micrococcales bacterium]|nr:ubiquitin-like protein Pup [Micrococcales bacterium]